MTERDKERRAWSNALTNELTKNSSYFSPDNKHIQKVLPLLWLPVVKRVMAVIESNPTERPQPDIIEEAITHVYPPLDESGAAPRPKHSPIEDITLMHHISKTNEAGRVVLDENKLINLVKEHGGDSFNPLLVKAYQQAYTFALGRNYGVEKMWDVLNENRDDMRYFLRDKGRIVQAYDFFAADILRKSLGTEDYASLWFVDVPTLIVSDDGKKYAGGFVAPHLICGEIVSWMTGQHTDYTPAAFFGVFNGKDSPVLSAIASNVIKHYKDTHWYYKNVSESYSKEIVRDFWSKGMPMGTKTRTLTTVGVIPIPRKGKEKAPEKRIEPPIKEDNMTTEDVRELLGVKKHENRLRLLKPTGDYGPNLRAQMNDVMRRLKDDNLLQNVKIRKVKKLNDVPILDLENDLVEYFRRAAIEYNKASKSQGAATRTAKAAMQELDKLKSTTSTTYVSGHYDDDSMNEFIKHYSEAGDPSVVVISSAFAPMTHRVHANLTHVNTGFFSSTTMLTELHWHSKTAESTIACK